MKKTDQLIKATIPIFLLALILAYSLYSGLSGCGGGGGGTDIVVTVVDRNGNAIAGAAILAGNPAIPDIQTTTDGSGKASLPSGSLSSGKLLTVGAAGYRSYAVSGATAAAITVALNELSRAHGYVKAAIDDATWGDLRDDIPNGIYRFAWVIVPADDLTEPMDMTDCAACIKNTTLVVPGKAGEESMTMPAHLAATRLFAFAGLLDEQNGVVTISKAGLAAFVMDVSNTAANPKEVAVPLLYDLGEDTAVTLSVLPPFPTGTDENFLVLSLDIPGAGIALMGITTNLNVGGIRQGDHSYAYKAFNSDELPADSEVKDSTYRVLIGYGDDREVLQSFKVDALPVTNQPQSATAETLLETPQGIIPAEGAQISLGGELLSHENGLSIYWDEVENADVYFVRLGVPFFNGLAVESIPFWQGVTPFGTPSLAMRTEAWQGQTEFQNCSMYMINVDAMASEAYNYADGVYPLQFDMLINGTPALLSSNQSIFFTGGSGCGPLMSRIWPYGGGSGTEVTITGKYFGTERGANAVSFGALPVSTYVSWSDSQIVVQAPAGGTGAAVGLSVTVNGVTSNVAYFELGN